MTFLTEFRRAFSAEVYKLKHSTIPVSTVILPAAVVITMNFILPLISNGTPFGTPRNAWIAATIGMLQMWIMVRTFHVGIITAQIAGLEHSSNAWKYLFALPVSRGTILLAKITLSLVLFGISMAVMLISLVITGYALSVLKPGLGFAEPIPFGDMAALILISYVASWLMIVLQTWAALHWHSFAGPMGLASVAFLLTLGLSSNPTMHRIFPWSLPTNFIVTGLNLTGRLIDADIAATSILISLVGSVIVATFSTWLLARRDVL